MILAPKVLSERERPYYEGVTYGWSKTKVQERLYEEVKYGKCATSLAPTRRVINNVQNDAK